MASPKSLSDDFDAEADLSAAFDAEPDAPAPAVAPAAPSEPATFSPRSTSGTVLRGMAQGSSFGFGDELEGLVKSGAANLAKAPIAMMKNPLGRRVVRGLMKGKLDGVSDAGVDAFLDRLHAESAKEALGVDPLASRSVYQQARDEARRELKQSSEANPKTYLGANLVGSLLVPGPKGLKKVGGAVVRPWVTRATAGALGGAAAGAGMSEEEGVGGVVEDALISGGIGGVAAPVLGGGHEWAGKKLAPLLERFSRRQAMQAGGLTSGITDKARALGYDKVEDLEALGAWARDEGLIPAFRKTEAVAKRAASALDESVSAKQAAVDEIEAMAQAQGRGFDFDALATASDKLKPKQGWDPLSYETAKKAMDMLGKASAAEGGFPMAEQVRQAAGKSINWKAPSFGVGTPAEVAAQRKAYGVIADEIAQQAQDVEARALLSQGRVPTPDDLGASNQIAAMNRRISKLMDINALASAEATRDAARGAIGMKDWLAAGVLGGGAASGHTLEGIIGGGLLALGSRVARDRGPSLMTHVAHRGAQVAETIAPAFTAAEPAVMRAVQGTAAQRASRNAFDALAQRFGITAKSKEELADEAYLKQQQGQME